MRLLYTLRDWLDARIDDAEESCASVERDRRAASAATRALAIYIATSYIANAISKCEIKVFERGRAVKNELYWALNVSPNPNQNASEFWNGIVSKCLCDRSVLMVQPMRTRNWFYAADGFTPDVRPMQETVYTGVSVEGEMVSRDFRASEACLFRLEDRTAAACVRALYEDLGALLWSADDAYKKAKGDRFTWKTNGRARGSREEGAQEAGSVNDQLAPFITGANGVLPLKEGQELTRIPGIQMDAKEPMELRRTLFDFTAQAFKIPSSMMYGNMTNSSDIVNQFITFAVDPYAVMLSDEMTRTFFTYDEWDGGRTRVKVDTNNIGHIDVFQMADKVDKLFAGGIYSMDEIRARVGDDELGTEFSKAHWITKNYALIEDALDRLESTTSAEGGETE